MDRERLLTHFLADAGWGTANRQPLAGDASSRRYERLRHPRYGRAVLMDAPPAKGEDVRPFRQISAYLRANAFSVPAELAADPDNGFLLLEDLGDDRLAELMAADPGRQIQLYDAATDALVALARLDPPDFLTPYSRTMTDRSGLAWTWYRKGLAGDHGRIDEANQEMARLIASLSSRETCFIHRDWHVENMIYLPDRPGVSNIGILDFQDAQIGFAGYDLISMSTDARRDVAPDLQQRMVARYARALGLDDAAFARDCAILAVQRNLRILGIFARLSMHFAKPHYVDFIPRVWGHLLANLAHPDLVQLRAIVLSDLPEPGATELQRLKALCGTVPEL